MSGLIKAATAPHSVTPFPGRAQPAPSRPSAAVVAQPPAEDPRLAQLRKENAELRKMLAELRETLPAAEAEAREQGRREALASARDDDQARIELLRKGTQSALSDWSARLDSLEALAALLAHTALSKLFDQSENLSDLVVRMIGRQVATLRRETLTGVRVSARDFPEDAAIDRLAKDTGLETVTIFADPNFAPGDCRLDLQLGHIDLGVSGHWSQLSGLLLGMAVEEQDA